MTQQLIHKSYRDILAKLNAESAERQSIENQTLKKLKTAGIEDSIYFPNTPKKTRVEGKFLLIGFAIGALIIGGIFLFSLLQNRLKPEPIPEIKSAPVSIVPSVKTDDATIANEVDLIKKILSGLVKSVQVLSEERARQEPQQKFPYPVKVTSEKANLRSSPGLGGKSIGVVSKDTILLAINENKGWLEVSTPKGELAWISQDIIVAGEE